MSAMQWTEVSLILYERTCDSYSVDDVTNEFNYLRERRIDSLQDLLDLSPDELKQFADFSRKGKVLSKEIKKIQLECQKDGNIYQMGTHPSYGDPCTYNHWLPVNQSRLLGRNNHEIENSWEKILATQYKEFDTLCHVTHIDAAATIFKEMQLKSNTVQDNSVFSKVLNHPNKDTKVLWFSPVLKETLTTHMKSKYGNVAFIMDKLDGNRGIMRYEDGQNAWNYYFVEVIDYRRQSACRIHATTKTYPHLTPYDPTKKGGPWYYDKESKKHYWLRDIMRWDGTWGSNGNSLEIMREENSSKPRLRWFNENLMFYPIAEHPKCIKHGCRCQSKNMSDTALRVYIMYQAYKPVFKPFMPDDLKIAMKEICAKLKITCQDFSDSEDEEEEQQMFLKGAEIAVNPRRSVDDIIGAMNKFPSLQGLNSCLEEQQ